VPLFVKSRRHSHRKQRALRVRGDVVHTFGTLLTPCALGCMILGFYLLGSAFKDPLAADSTMLLTASLLLSLGFMLTSYILRSAMSGIRSGTGIRTARSGPEKPAAPPLGDERVAESPLPFRSTYTDPARVRR